MEEEEMHIGTTPARDSLYLVDGTLNPFGKIVSSVVGSSITALVVTPFDVVKARLQAQIDPKGEKISPSRFSGSLDAVTKITKLEGPLNLWRGLGTTLILTLPTNAIYFTSYDTLKTYMQDKLQLNSVFVPAIAGLSARVFAVLVSSPIELVRTHLQATSSIHVANIGLIPTLRTIFQNGGISSLWSGLSPTLWRDVPFSAIYWGGYEMIKNKILPFAGPERKFLVDFTSGATSGILAACISHPFDVIKTRRQMLIPTNTNRYNKENHRTIQLLNKIVNEEGWKGLTKGLLPRVVKIAPACAIMISSYELCKKYLAEG